MTPAAFYRHFDDMEELGLALIEESFDTLRAMLREARAELANFDQVIRDSVEILVRHVHEHRLQYQFIARERYGGVAVLRHAIRTEIRLFSSDLALDLSRFPGAQGVDERGPRHLCRPDGHEHDLDRRGRPRRAAR